MNKFYKIFFFLIFLIYPISSFSHVEHYDNLKKIEFDIYRNNKNIGKHIFTFEKENNELSVKSEINFIIKKLGVTLYKYHVKGVEIYKDGVLYSFNSKTNQNGKEKYVNMKLEDEDFIIDGSSYKGKAPTTYLLGTWWNHSIVKAPAQISAVSGRINEQSVTFIGKEQVKIGDKTFNTLRYNFKSSDETLKDSTKLNTDIWYDEKTLIWVKAAFDKTGYWEYRIKTYK